MNIFGLFGPGRPSIMARDHVVVSLASLQVLEAGGNAIETGVATGLAIDVLKSERGSSG